MIDWEDMRNVHADCVGLVIGNGESRKSIDLTTVPESVVTFGCNALYRDYAPDYLGSVDLNMSNELCKAGYHADHKVVAPATRMRQWEQPNKLRTR